MTTQTDEQPTDLFERKSVRWVLFIVVPAVTFILVCAGIRVSQYGIDHTIIVFGQKEIVAGWPAAIRVTLMADGGGFFLPTRLTGHLVRGDERHLLFDGATENQGYALACNFRVPQLEAGPAALELNIQFDERQRIVRSPVEVMLEPPAIHFDLPDDAAINSESFDVIKDGVRLQAFTEDRGAPTGLTSVVFVRALKDDGEPVAASFELEISGTSSDGAVKQEHHTDRLGLLALPMKPRELALPIKVLGSRYEQKANHEDAGVQQQDAHLFPKVVYGGITAAVHNPILEKGEPLRISVEQISGGGPVNADIFHEGRWVQATSSWFGGRSANLDIRLQRTGIGRVQITTSALAPGRTIAVRHFYVLDQDEDLTQGLRAILTRLKSVEAERAWSERALAKPLEQGAGYSRHLAAAFALSRLYTGHQILPRLISSRREDDAELNAFKARFQRTIMVAILLLGFGVASMISMMAIHAQRRQQRITMMIMADGGDEEDTNHQWQTDIGARSSKRRVVFQGAILFLIILGAFASIALLIDTLTWR